MNKLINALTQLHHIGELEARETVKQIMKGVDEGYNPIELLEEMGLTSAHQWDLLDCYINF